MFSILGAVYTMTAELATTPRRRNRIRFTLRGLLITVTVAAIGSAALANPTDLWASVVFSGTLALLMFYLLLAVVRRGAARAVAMGFVLCGGAYLALVLVPGAETNIVPNLVTSRVLTEAETAWHNSTPSVSSISSPSSIPLAPQGNILTGFGGSPTVRLWSMVNGQVFVPGGSNWSTSPFQRIGHCLWTLLLATLGCVAARFLYIGGEEGTSAEQIVVPPR